MSLRTQTWDELIESVEGYVPLDASKSRTRIKSTINQAAKKIWNNFKWLDRYLIVAEPRTVSRGQIESTEDSFHVYGAGTDAVNGLYQRNGTANGANAYSLFDSDGTTELYSLWRNTVPAVWYISQGDVGDTSSVQYQISSSSSTPPLSEWTTNGGTAPAPLLVDVAEIALMLHVDKYNIYQDRTSLPVEFYTVGSNYVLNDRNPQGIYYCTYQKALSDTYGDGTGGTTSDIPEEFFEYFVLYAARAEQIRNRQSNSNPLYGGVTQQEVNDAFDSIGMRAENLGNIANVQRRVQTHLATDTTLV